MLKLKISIKVVFGIYFLCLFYSCKHGTSSKSIAQKNGVETKIEALIIRESRIENDLQLPGQMQAVENVSLKFEHSGRLIYLNIQEGRHVSKGTIIAKLDDSELQAKLNKLETQKVLYEKEHQRYLELFKIKGVSSQEYDEVTNKLNNLKADIQILKINISKTILRTPFSGVLGIKQVSIGALLDPSTPLVSLQQIIPLKLTFKLPERYKDLIKKDKLIRFRKDGAENDSYAKVDFLDSQIDALNHDITVVCKYQNTEASMLPGSFVNISLNLKAKNNSLLVPTQVIIPEARSKKVAKIQNNKVVLQNVETGIRSDDSVEILSGLKKGDTIAMTGIMQLREGQTVKFLKIN